MKLQRFFGCTPRKSAGVRKLGLFRVRRRVAAGCFWNRILPTIFVLSILNLGKRCK